MINKIGTITPLCLICGSMLQSEPQSAGRREKFFSCRKEHYLMWAIGEYKTYEDFYYNTHSIAIDWEANIVYADNKKLGDIQNYKLDKLSDFEYIKRLLILL